MDFRNLKPKDLKQKPRKIRNWLQRIKLGKAIQDLDFFGSLKLLDEIKGAEFVERVHGKVDCLQYAMGEVNLEKLAQGSLKHNGNPREGDIIIYGHDINYPSHCGIWLNDERVISKLGDYGPVIKHGWNQVFLQYGKIAFFSRI